MRAFGVSIIRARRGDRCRGSGGGPARVRVCCAHTHSCCQSARRAPGHVWPRPRPRCARRQARAGCARSPGRARCLPPARPRLPTRRVAFRPLAAGCIVIDEAHMIGDTGRGTVYEGLIAKLLRARCRLRKQGAATPQIVAVSGTLRNGRHIAAWLSAGGGVPRAGDGGDGGGCSGYDLGGGDALRAGAGAGAGAAGGLSLIHI